MHALLYPPLELARAAAQKPEGQTVSVLGAISRHLPVPYDCYDDIQARAALPLPPETVMARSTDIAAAVNREATSPPLIDIEQTLKNPDWLRKVYTGVAPGLKQIVPSLKLGATICHEAMLAGQAPAYDIKTLLSQISAEIIVSRAIVPNVHSISRDGLEPCLLFNPFEVMMLRESVPSLQGTYFYQALAKTIWRKNRAAPFLASINGETRKPFTTPFKVTTAYAAYVAANHQGLT